MDHQYTGFSLRILYVFKLVIKRLSLTFFCDDKEGDVAVTTGVVTTMSKWTIRKNLGSYFVCYFLHMWKDTRLCLTLEALVLAIPELS